MKLFKTLLTMSSIILFAATHVSADYCLTTGMPSPFALFYEPGYGFHSVTSSFSASTNVTDAEVWWAVEGAGIWTEPSALSTTGGNSITITEQDMESSSTGHWGGVFYLAPYISSHYVGWDSWIDPGNNLNMDMFWGLTPVSMDTKSKTVHYSYQSADDFGAYTERNYLIFQPDGQIVASHTITSDTGALDITYSMRGPYAVAADGVMAPPAGCTCECTPAFWGNSDIETPQFTIPTISVSTSTATYNQYQLPYPIEPAYGDTVTFHWSKSCNEFYAQSILILTEDPANGTIVDPNDSTKKYSIAATVPLSDSTNVVTPDFSTTFNTTGDLTWPENGADEPQFPAGQLRLGVQYDDGYVQLLDQYIQVDLSIYNVYTDNHAPFYAGDATEGKTSIYYTMSDSDSDPGGNVSIAIQNVNISPIQTVRTIQGTTNAGQNVLTDAWDGTDSTGNYVPGGSYPMTFSVSFPAAQQGQPDPPNYPKSLGWMLSIYSITHNPSFTPALGDTLPIDFTVSEQVLRPQATVAYVDAAVYDSGGQFVRLLANQRPMNIRNNPWASGGNNTLTWDGKDEQGNVVDAGTYTITLFAKDNAGVGCESPCVVTTVQVADPPQTIAELDWPGGGDAGGDDGTGGVDGYTNSGTAVYYSLDNGAQQQVTPDSDGDFTLSLPQTAGSHTMALSTPAGTYPAANISVPFFINTLAIASPADDARFDPQTNGNISIQLTSQTSDVVDITVVNPYNQPSCNSPQAPVPAAEMMNGTVTDQTVRTLATGLAVAAGTNPLFWDGKDDSGNFVPPGVYQIVVQSENQTALPDIPEATVNVVVEHPAGASAISGVTSTVDGSSISVSWTTGVATTGYVVYEVDGSFMGRVSTSGAAATTHTVWLAATTPSTTYNYYVIAVNPTTGAPAVSAKGTATTTDGVVVDGVSLTPSPGQMQISGSTDTPVAEAIEYAQVGPGTSPIQWERAEHAYKDQDHTFTLTGLQPNAEYAYRFVTAADGTWANSTKGAFSWFTTKTAPSNVSFTNLTDGEGVTSLTDITVQAGDPIHRFSSYGITSVELYVDDVPVGSYDVTPGTDSVVYTFHAASMNLTDGVHQLDAVAYDDFWRTTHSRIQVLVDSTGGGLQSMSVSKSSPLFTLASQSGFHLDKERHRGHVMWKRGFLEYNADKRPPGPPWCPRSCKLTGSLGALILFVNDVMVAAWDATSGYHTSERAPDNCGTIPEGEWYTNGTEGSYGQGHTNLGAYWFQLGNKTHTHPWHSGRVASNFFIHGGWVHDVAHHIRHKTYYHSAGCIMLENKNVMALKAYLDKYDPELNGRRPRIRVDVHYHYDSWTGK